jgi:hypothetical protein
VLTSRFYVVPSHSLVFEARPYKSGVHMYQYSDDSLSKPDGYRCVFLDNEQVGPWIGYLAPFYEIAVR